MNYVTMKEASEKWDVPPENKLLWLSLFISMRRSHSNRKVLQEGSPKGPARKTKAEFIKVVI